MPPVIDDHIPARVTIAWHTAMTPRVELEHVQPSYNIVWHPKTFPSKFCPCLRITEVMRLCHDRASIIRWTQVYLARWHVFRDQRCHARVAIRIAWWRPIRRLGIIPNMSLKSSVWSPGCDYWLFTGTLTTSGTAHGVLWWVRTHVRNFWRGTVVNTAT